MLKREADSIVTAVGQSWQVLRASEAAKFTAARDAVQETFRKDTRFLDVVAALAAAGVADPSADAFRGMTSFSSKAKGSWQADMKAAMAAVPNLTPPMFSATPLYGELNIALSTSTKKWPALQGDVYILIADLGSAKMFTNIEVAVRRFTTALA